MPRHSRNMKSGGIWGHRGSPRSHVHFNLGQDRANQRTPEAYGVRARDFGVLQKKQGNQQLEQQFGFCNAVNALHALHECSAQKSSHECIKPPQE